MAGPRVLFIRPAAFGDVLLTTPFRRRLLEREPDCSIDLYTLHGQAWPPGAGRVLDMKILSLAKIINDDYPRTHVFSYEHTPHLHILDAYQQTSGLDLADRTLDWTLQPPDALWAGSVLPDSKGPVIGLHPASGTATRSLPPGLVPALVQGLRARLGATVVLTGLAPLEAGGALDLTGRVASMGRLGALLARMDAFITVDSGPFHLAQALGVPTVAVFGCTLPELRATRPDRLQVVLQSDLACLGCHHQGAPGAEALSGCARGDLACMAQVEPQAILQAVEHVLEGRPDAALADRLRRYEDRRPALLASGPGRDETLAAFQAGLRRLDRHLGGFKRWRRQLRAWFKTWGPARSSP